MHEFNYLTMSVIGQLHKPQKESIKMKLFISAITKYLLGLLLIGVMLFIPAGTVYYPGAWLFVALLFIPMLILGVLLFVKSPRLLEKRLDNKESEKTQKGVIALSGLMFPVGFVLSALDFRFGWSAVPTWLVILASILFLSVQRIIPIGGLSSLSLTSFA